jgi:hypothetical protein
MLVRAGAGTFIFSLEARAQQYHCKVVLEKNQSLKSKTKRVAIANQYIQVQHLP